MIDLLYYRIRLEGMLAENAQRALHGYLMAYTADEFDALALELTEVERENVNTVLWSEHTCGECGYYIGKSKSGSFIGCRKMPGNTTKDCRACPDLVLVPVCEVVG